MSEPRIVKRGQAPVLNVEMAPEVMMGSGSVAGAYVVFEQRVPHGQLGTPHVHENEDQIAYVLDGTIGFYVGGEEFIATKGDVVLRPRGIPHALWNPTDTDSRMLEVTSPGAVEVYFSTMQDLLMRDAGPDEIAKLAHDWGIAFKPELIAELETRHSVRHEPGAING